MADLVLAAGIVVYNLFGMAFLALAAGQIVYRVYSWFGMVYLVLTVGQKVYRVYSLVWYGLQLVWYGLPGADSRRGSVQSVQFGLAWLTWC